MLNAILELLLKRLDKSNQPEPDPAHWDKIKEQIKKVKAENQKIKEEVIKAHNEQIKEERIKVEREQIKRINEQIRTRAAIAELYNFDPGTYQNPKQKMTAFDTLMVTNVNYADHIGQVIANKHNQTYLQQGGDVKKRLQAKLVKKKKQK